MKRVVFLLAAAALACAVACLAAYHFKMRTPPEVWLGKQLGLEGRPLEEFTAAHNRYASTCALTCARIRASDAHLSGLIRSARGVTPEIEAAMAASDALRHECRKNMLRHFYDVADMLDPEKRAAYIELVMPLVVQPGLMSEEHHCP